jgi:hypothetical protein
MVLLVLIFQLTLLLISSSIALSLISLSRESAAKQIIQSFEPRIFIPSSGFLNLQRNCHWQTIVGSSFVKELLERSCSRSFETRSEIITTEDDDSFEVEYTTNVNESDSICILLHGLESSSKSTLISKMTQSFLSKGFGCCLVNFRGCNGVDNNTPGAYHLGFTDDLKTLVSHLNHKYPNKELYLSGFSLGGNVILKFLGELGSDAHERNIRGAGVFCVPFDPVQCQKKIDSGFNRAVYSVVSPYLRNYFSSHFLVPL